MKEIIRRALIGLLNIEHQRTVPDARVENVLSDFNVDDSTPEFQEDLLKHIMEQFLLFWWT